MCISLRSDARTAMVVSRTKRVVRLTGEWTPYFLELVVHPRVTGAALSETGVVSRSASLSTLRG